jgi:hypothetical protein
MSVDPIGTLWALAEAAKLISELEELYSSSLRELSLMHAQIGFFQAHVEIIQKWLDSSPEGTTRPASIVENIQKTLGLLADAIKEMTTDLERIQSPSTSRVGSFMSATAGHERVVKAKYSLNAGLLQRHLAHLQDCGAVLGLALQATQL